MFYKRNSIALCILGAICLLTACGSSDNVSSIDASIGTISVDDDVADKPFSYEDIESTRSKLGLDISKTYTVDDNAEVVLEKRNTSDNVIKKGRLFTTPDDIECTDIRIEVTYNDEGVKLMTDGQVSDRYDFVVDVIKPDGDEKYFDTTLFVLETSSGELVDPCVAFASFGYKVPVIESEMSIRCAISNPKDIKEGDYINVYYDGVFITSVPVVVCEEM